MSTMQHDHLTFGFKKNLYVIFQLLLCLVTNNKFFFLILFKYQNCSIKHFFIKSFVGISNGALLYVQQSLPE